MSTDLVVRPIGFVRSPFTDKADAPRQAVAAEGVEATIEILPAYEDALADLEGFDRVWVLFWFDRAARAEGEPLPSKVLPPRSEVKRGVFATRSPHRPNPIGMSAVRLAGVEGRTVRVRDVDLLDGTPVLDLKPYLPYADSFPESRAGWLERSDPIPSWTVSFAPEAEAELAFVAERTGFDLRARLVETLSLGPRPRAYRRIKDLGGGVRLVAIKEWRARFTADEAARVIEVASIASGYRARDLAEGATETHAVHRDFVARFGAR